MVQIGNEITAGMLWPQGKIYVDGAQRWDEFTTLLKAGIAGARASSPHPHAPRVMVHIDRGGDNAGRRRIMAVVFLLSFQSVWSDYITPALLLDINGTTLAVRVATGYIDPTGTTLPNLLAAGALLYALPVVVVFIVLQRFLVQGIVTTGLKG
jgi:hypothetical protein